MEARRRPMGLGLRFARCAVRRHVLALAIVLAFTIDVTFAGVGHALTWLFGIITGLAIGWATQQ